MKTLITTAVSAALIATSFAGEALDATTNLKPLSRPDSHAPIGVMGDHTHQAGEWMFSYRFMTMHMEQLYRGSDKVATSGAMMSPSEMDMDMHMLGLMYAPTDKLTLMLMSNYIETSMTMANPMGVETMKMKTSGLGDTSISGLYQFYKEGNKNAHFGFGISLPTGDTGKKIANAPMPPAIGRDQPYPMQLGSGTYDLLPSLTYNHFINHDWSWGAQAKAIIRLSENDEGYTLGDNYKATAWVSRKINRHLSLNARIEANYWKPVSGPQTNGLPAMMSSPANPANSGGEKLDAYIGANYIFNSGARVALELGQTLYQDLDGVQLGYDWTAQLGFQYAF